MPSFRRAPNPFAALSTAAAGKTPKSKTAVHLMKMHYYEEQSVIMFKKIEHNKKIFATLPESEMKKNMEKEIKEMENKYKLIRDDFYMEEALLSSVGKK